MRTTIQHNILRTLRDASGHPLASDVLLPQVKDRTRPFPTDEDITSEVNHLLSVGFIHAQANELDPEAFSYVLSEKGEAYVIRKQL